MTRAELEKIYSDHAIQYGHKTAQIEILKTQIHENHAHLMDAARKIQEFDKTQKEKANDQPAPHIA